MHYTGTRTTTAILASFTLKEAATLHTTLFCSTMLGTVIRETLGMEKRRKEHLKTCHDFKGPNGVNVRRGHICGWFVWSRYGIAVTALLNMKRR